MRRTLHLLMWTLSGLVLLAATVLIGGFAWLGLPETGAGLSAKSLCSGVFVAGRRADDVIAADLIRQRTDAPGPAEGRRSTPEVTASMLWSRERRARALHGLGCVLDPTPALEASAGRFAAAAPGRQGVRVTGAGRGRPVAGDRTGRASTATPSLPPSTTSSATTATRPAATPGRCWSCTGEGSSRSATVPASTRPPASSAGR